jgi:thiamine biosynthesis lipoprotein
MPPTVTIPPAHTVHALGGDTMGTTWSVQVVAGRDCDLHALHHRVQVVLDRVVAQMSTWEPDSDISRFNRAEAGHWQAIPGEFLQVLRTALVIAEASGGAFDPTVGGLVGLWGFGAQAQPRGATDGLQQRRLAANAGWDRLQLDVPGSRVLQTGGLILDLSAIAKGYAVDAVAEALRRDGIGAALIEVGGELFGYGRKPDGTPWRVLMESTPEEEQAAQLEPRVVELDGKAVATSGDRWHAYEHQGERISHTLDPRSARPVAQSSAGVTVLAASAMEADAWATAMTVLGAEQGLALAERLSLAVRFVDRTPQGLQERSSSALSAMWST